MGPWRVGPEPLAAWNGAGCLVGLGFRSESGSGKKTAPIGGARLSVSGGGEGEKG
jgi:hypothetical protein